jgi:hypothetical protein
MTLEPRPCCPEGYPDAWHEKEIRWEDKPFVKARVRSVFHIPLNFGGVLMRNVRRMEAVGAMPDDLLVITDENSLWGADMYLAATHDVPEAANVRLSGTFLTKVFEGPFSRIPAWIEEMKRYVTSKGRTLKHLYFLYRTCPKCAKKYGKNYVVLLAEVPTDR